MIQPVTQSILLVEDSPGDALLIQEVFNGTQDNGFILEWVETLSAAFEYIQSGKPVAAVLLDLSLPDGYGFQTVSQMIKAVPHIPVIILTGLEDEALAIKAVKAGAQDYLIKGQVYQNSLSRTVRYAIERKQIQEELQASETRYRLLAENIIDVVFISTPDLFILDITPSVTRMLGYQPDELIGVHLEHLLTGASLSRLKQVLNEETAIEASEQERTPFWSRRVELEFIRKRGATVWTEVKFNILKKSDSALTHQTEKGEKGINKPAGEVKPPDTSFQYLYGVARDITERRYWEETLKQANESLKVLATRDPLTGLFNRRYMEETLDRELHRASREKYQIGLVMFDIDHFKNFNDLYGHVAGDTILRKLGEVLKNNTRHSDVACRYGGEEFIIVVPNATPNLAFERAVRIRDEVKKINVVHNGKTINSISISAGVAIYPQNGKNVDTLLQAADAALYEAKAQGRDQVHVAVVQPEKHLPANKVGVTQKTHHKNQ